MSAGDVSPRAPHPWWGRICLGIIVILVLLLFPKLAFLSELPFRCLFGWAVHLWVMVPVLLPQWRGLLLPMACTGISLWLGHGFIRWGMAANESGHRWSLSRTAALFGLLLLCSGAAIAMSGVVHQLAWLLKEPCLTNGIMIERTRAMSQVRRLLDGIAAFCAENGRYPDGLGELESFQPDLARDFWIEVGGASAPERVIYLRPPPELAGEAGAAESTLLVSPALQPNGRVVLGRGDLSAVVVERAQAEEILRKAMSHGN